MPPSPLPPAEILLQILSVIPLSDRSTFFACLLSCRGFYPAASVRLYKTIRISSHHPFSPLYDAKPSPPAARGSLARRRGTVGPPTRSRKAKLLDNVRVLELDGRKGGSFSGAKVIDLPRVRTLLVDMSLTKMLREREGEGGGWTGDYGQYDKLAGIKPKLIVIKHLGFHESTDLLADLPLPTLSQVKRLVYLVDYTTWDSDSFGRTYGPSHSMTSFGLHQWLDGLADPPRNLTTVDIVFWTSAPRLNFSTPSNKYTFMRPAAGQTWLDLYIAHIGQSIPISDKISFNFVNTGSFDRHAINAQEWEYEKVQDVFREKLLEQLGRDPAKREKAEKELQCLSIGEWLDGMSSGGMDVGDVLTQEELGPWLEPQEDRAESLTETV